MSIGSQFFEYLINVAFGAGVAMFLLGVLILIAPNVVFSLSRRLNVWISTDAVFDRLDSAKTSESFIYRHHRFFGTLFLLGALYTFYIFVFVFDADTQKISILSNNVANDWLLKSFVFINIFFSVLIFIIGLIVIFRPSLLKGIESTANRWFFVDQKLKKLDVELKTADNIFAARPRILGLIIVLGSLYICFNLWVFI